MKVKLIDDNWELDRKKWAESYGVVFPEKGVIYTVRGVTQTSNYEGFLLEEIVNPILTFNSGIKYEPIFLTDRFEILLPEEIEEMIKDLSISVII